MSHGWRPRRTGRRSAHAASLRAAGAVPDRRDWSSRGGRAYQSADRPARARRGRPAGSGPPEGRRAPTVEGLSGALLRRLTSSAAAIVGPARAHRAPKPPGWEGLGEGIRCGLRHPVVGLVGLNPCDRARAGADARGPRSGPGAWHAPATLPGHPTVRDRAEDCRADGDDALPCPGNTYGSEFTTVASDSGEGRASRRG
jgi:hypothetical protein